MPLPSSAGGGPTRPGAAASHHEQPDHLALPTVLTGVAALGDSYTVEREMRESAAELLESLRDAA